MRSRWSVLLLLALVSCRRDSVLRVVDRAKIISRPLSSPLSWEHAESNVFVECDGRRVAESMGVYSVSPAFIAAIELQSPDELLLVDTHSCEVFRPLRDPALGEVEWNANGTLGFVSANAAYVLHAAHPPVLEKISEAPWLEVGMPFQPSAWSASGETVLLKRFVGEQCLWATWHARRGFELFSFTEDVCREVKLAWRGETPTAVLADGRVIEPKR